MNTDIIIGIVITICALSLLTGLTIWSKKTIDRISKKGYQTYRKIITGTKNEK